MGDIIKRIRKMRQKEPSPLDKLLEKDDGSSREEEGEDIEVTHYGRTVAGGEPAEEPKKAGFQQPDLESDPAELGILKSKAFREISMDDLDREPELASDRGPDNDPAAGEEPVIRLATRDEGKIKHLRLICRLLEEGFYDQAIEAVRDLAKLN